MVIIHSWGSSGRPGERRVLPSVTVIDEATLYAQAFFIWGWCRAAAGNG